jgi:hypothetical protein
MGWLIVIAMEDVVELDDLFDARGYNDFIMQDETG